MTEEARAKQGQVRLFADAVTEPSARGRNAADAMSLRIRSSMLWAAYGDALGFVSELTDRKGLERRTHGKPLDHLMAWQRRIGGRRGIEVRAASGVLVRRHSASNGSKPVP